MRIFLSYSSSDRVLAQQTELALRSAGYQVFFDRKDLPAGESFDVRILEAIEQSDLLIYLVSPASVKPGAYALTELGFARKRWRHPDRRIIPVMVGPVSLDALPPYLRAVTLLEPEGNVVAEILESVNALSGWRRYKRRIGQAVWGRWLSLDWSRSSHCGRRYRRAIAQSLPLRRATSRSGCWMLLPRPTSARRGRRHNWMRSTGVRTTRFGLVWRSIPQTR